MQSLRVQMQSATHSSKPQNIHSASNSTAGSLTQRPYRGEWNKLNSISSSQPLNPQRSIDNRSMKDKKSNSNDNSGSKVQQPTSQNFLFNTYQATGQQHIKPSQSLEKNQSRHLSIKGWMNPSTSQQNQQTSILKNLLLSSHSGQTSNHGRSIESSNSSTNLMLDSGVLSALQLQNTLTSSNEAENKFKTFNELQSQLDSFNASRVAQVQQTKQRSELASVLQSFAPPLISKSGKKTQNKLRMASDPAASTTLKQELKFSNEFSQPDINQKYVEQPSSNVEDNKLDYSLDDEVDKLHGDINESVVHFKTSTHLAKSQDPTPKSGSLLSYKNSIQSHEKVQEMNSLGGTSGKESRNQIQGFLSQQFPQDGSSMSNTLFNSKAAVTTKTSDGQNKRLSQINNNSNSSKKLKGKQHQQQKSKQKIQTQNSFSLSNQNNPPPNLAIGQKTPTDVFSYKIKTQTTTAFNQPNLKLENLVKNPQSQPASHRQTVASNYQKKPSLKYSAKVVSGSKPPTGAKDQEKTMNKCGSEKETLYISQQNALHLTDEIENENIKFLYATTEDTGQNAPPNSSNILSPPDTEIKKQTSQVNLLSKQFEDGAPKVKVLDFDLESPAIDSKQCIRVVSRFRPFNKLENELKETQQTNLQVVAEFYNDCKTIKIKEEFVNHSNNNLVFTFDYVFNPNTSQQAVFDLVGSETISDIMEGYNGTIFAYGQTGSGKTFTMYGLDMFDEQLMGIIPRSARQIFQHIKSQDLEIEYQIRLQMVEIYKETLRDLLHDSPSQPPELKIKEDPKRGTYVEGLTEVCIVSEEEMMAVLCTGETMRHVSSTSLNKLSSRSHSICIVEIIQKFPNDSEKRGLLNLVDLAGSERVSKSHAQGQALEEAKKINFSLSMLGKVINSLTKNSSYIPYRDSKLTRLLKESLGGNNKTTLIVACSPHQSNIEETMSTLRFAQSAKFIQNKVKINMKTSPEQLQGIIEQLKQELRNCKEEIYKLRITSTCTHSQQQSQSQKQLDCKSSDLSELNSNDLNIFQPSQSDSQLIPNELDKIQKILMPKPTETMENKHTLHNRPHQSLLAKNYDLIETNNYRMQMLSLFSSELSNIPGNGTPNFISPVKNYEIKLLQLINRNDDLEMKLKSKEKDIQAMQSDKEELHSKVSSLEEKLINYKQKLLVMEKKVADYESQKELMIVKEVKQTNKIEDYQSQINVLTQMVQCLERALEDTESNCQQLLKEKTNTFQKQIKDFLNETVKYKRIQISEALDQFINKPKPNGLLGSKNTQSSQNLLSDYVLQEKIISESDQIVSSLNEKDLLQQNLYSLELVNAIEDCPPEIIIYLLKQLLIESAIANHNLQRVLAVNRWRQVMEFGKHKIKAKLCKVQESTIDSLEQVLEKTRKTHDKLRARVDKLENHLYDNRNQFGDLVMLTEGNPSQPSIINKNQQVLGNQSIISVMLNSNQHQQNQKTRFVRTITNKTLGKVFNFIEKSPHSRGSVGNQSILSQIYAQGQQTNKNKLPAKQLSGTPLRTNNMNSPAIYNFQSPIRRQNTVFIGTQNNQQPGKVQLPQIFSYMVPNQEVVATNLIPDILQNDRTSGSVSLIGPPSVNNRMSDEIQNAVNKIDQMNFEDAIAKFFSQSEQQEAKNNPKTQSLSGYDIEQKGFVKFSDEDLKLVDQFDNLQGLKEFIRIKIGKDRPSVDKLQQSAQIQLNHNPLFVQYQQNLAQNQSQTNLGANSDHEGSNPQQINSHTTNNNLYGQSNDFYEQQNHSSQKGLPCSSSGNYHDNQRQEHVLTIASDYMITSNSVIGPNALFNGAGQNGFIGEGAYYVNDCMDRLQEKIVHLQEEVETQKCRAEEHKKAYYESKKQIEQMRVLMEEKESIFTTMIKNEICQWESVLEKFREMTESELLRKQKEIEKLHEILAQWIENYQHLEKSNKSHHQQANGNRHRQEMDKLLKEQFNSYQVIQNSQPQEKLVRIPVRSNESSKYQKVRLHKDNQYRLSSNLQKNLSMQKQTHKLQCMSANSLPRPPTTHMDQTPTSNANIFQTLQSYNNLQTANIDKKVINGDNSPVNQEESCLDLDQSIQQFLHVPQQTQSDGGQFDSMPLHSYESQNDF